MPKHFKFYVDNKIAFQCKLQSDNCTALNNNGVDTCKNKSVIGTPLCWRHLLKEKKVRILDSQYGKGLFALDTKKEPNDIIFRENDTIVKYEGEVLTQRIINERYSQYTAPYAAKINDNNIVDSACLRGVGSLINHATSKNANCRFSVYNGKLSIKATKNIRNNKELFINYNKGNTRGHSKYEFNETGVRHVTR